MCHVAAAAVKLARPSENTPHAGGGVIDVCIANNAPVPEKWLAPYRQEGVGQIELDREKIEALGVALREFPLCLPGRYIRHDPDALARELLRLYHEKSHTRVYG